MRYKYRTEIVNVDGDFSLPLISFQERAISVCPISNGRGPYMSFYIVAETPIPFVSRISKKRK